MRSALNAVEAWTTLWVDLWVNPWADASGESAELAVAFDGGFSRQALGLEPLAVLLECALRLVIVAAGDFFRRPVGLLGFELSAGRLSLQHVSMSSMGAGSRGRCDAGFRRRHRHIVVLQPC